MVNKNNLAIAVIVELVGWSIFFYGLSHFIGIWTAITIYGFILTYEGYAIGKKLDVY